MNRLNLKIILVTGIMLLSTAVVFAANPETFPLYHVNKDYNLVPNNPKSSKKIVLITIDDGPSKYTKDMLETLKKHKAPAIFFINGIHVKDYPENLKTISKAGYYIGNHTWDHKNLTSLKNDDILKEINNNSKIIKEKTGSNPHFFRSPFGAGNKNIKNIIKKSGMIYMNWSGSAKDWEKSAKEEKTFMKNVTSDLHNGEIILIHEHEWTSKYLDNLLTEIEKRGYTFLDPSQITE